MLVSTTIHQSIGQEQASIHQTALAPTSQPVLGMQRSAQAIELIDGAQNPAWVFAQVVAA